MLEIKVNLSSLQKIVDAYKSTPEAVEAGLDATANLVLDAKKREMLSGTYRRAIPTSKKGRPKWQRKGTSGGWLGEQEIQKSPGERTITPTGEPAKYEERLANLPAGPDGINRSNPAGEKAVRATEPQIQPVFEDAFRNKLGL